MESRLSHRVRMIPSPSTSSPPPSSDPTDWLEPSEEFPILFGLLTAHANSQQKNNNKDKPVQIRRRRNPRLAPSHVVRMEPDSSVREPGENPVNSSRPPPLLVSSRARKNLKRNDEDDAVPTSTTNDFDFLETSPGSSPSESEEATSSSSSGRISISTTTRDVDEPPRKRSRLEECLSRGLGQSYHYQRQQWTSKKTNPPKLQVQEMNITTNCPADLSIPTLNLRDLLAAEDLKARQFGESHFWKNHQFRFEKRKRFSIPEGNDLQECEEEDEDEARPFQCTECPQRFKRSYHLTRHLTIHWGERRFSCPTCNRACFQRKDNLTAHMKKCCSSGEEVNNGNNSLLQRQLLAKPAMRPMNLQNSPTGSNNLPNSWICLSKFMESAAAEEKNQESQNPSGEKDPLANLDLEMIEISEVSPEQSSDNSISLSLPSEPDIEDDVGVNLTVGKNNNTELEYECEVYPCGDCRKVFHDFKELIKHSRMAHIKKPNPDNL